VGGEFEAVERVGEFGGGAVCFEVFWEEMGLLACVALPFLSLPRRCYAETERTDGREECAVFERYLDLGLGKTFFLGTKLATFAPAFLRT
jgi:hypothetical protein